MRAMLAMKQDARMNSFAYLIFRDRMAATGIGGGMALAVSMGGLLGGSNLSIYAVSWSRFWQSATVAV